MLAGEQAGQHGLLARELLALGVGVVERHPLVADKYDINVLEHVGLREISASGILITRGNHDAPLARLYCRPARAAHMAACCCAV